jgi:diguanylate cyclase (GGDEF)-like protein
MLLSLWVLGLVAFEFRLVSMQVELAVATMALTDPLTGLANRRLLSQRLREEESRAARSQSNFCVIMADIDHFKRVNDTHGHEVGDRVLVEVGRLLTSASRTQDIVGRWGGEEFLLVLSNTSLAAAQEAAERLRKLAEAQLGVLANAGTVTLTLGVAQYDSSITQCLKSADDALYRGKTQGRNQVVVAEPGA